MFSLREHDHLSVKVETPVFEETGTPLYIPWSSSFSGPVQKEPTSVNNLGDPRVTVRNTPPSHSPRAPHSSMTLQTVQLPRGRADPPRAVPVVIFGAPLEDQMSITASEGERMSSGDEDLAALPPSGVAALPESDPEMAAMLFWAAARVWLKWNLPPSPETLRLDDWFLGVARAGSQGSASVPFLPEVHEEVNKSWMAPFFAWSRSRWRAGAVCGDATVSQDRYLLAG